MEEIATVGGGIGMNGTRLLYDGKFLTDTGMPAGEKSSWGTVIWPPQPGYGQVPRKLSMTGELTSVGQAVA